MDPLTLGQAPDRNGLIYRWNAGYRFRLGGGNAHNDGIQAEMDIGYQSRKFFRDQFSLETGSSLDLFGETEHLGAYLQLNYHPSERFILSLRTMGGGVSDDKETPPTETKGDSDDLGGVFSLSLLGALRIDPHFITGARVGYLGEAFGKGGGDQGTQHSLALLLSLAYQF